jgi:hypothetical protein
MQQVSTAGQWYLMLGWPVARQGQGMWASWCTELTT